MANPGIPTRKSHGKAVDDLMAEANGVFVQLEEQCRLRRIEMAAGDVGDDVIRDLWIRVAGWEADLTRFRRAPDFHNQYARYRGLSYTFDCTDDVNAGSDRIINLPDNHQFKVDHRVEFLLIDGSLVGGVSEGVNYWVRDLGNAFFGLDTAEAGGGPNVNLSNAAGRAEVLVNMRPDYGQLRTAVDLLLDEIEANLPQRAATYDRLTATLVHSSRTSVETGTLQARCSDIEALIDVIAA